MFKKVLAIGLLAGSLLTVLASPALAAPAVFPVQSCADIHANNPSAPDGDYTIYPNKRIMSVYCGTMSSAPREYLTLAQPGSSTTNFSNEEVGWAISGTSVVTKWNKVRLDPATLQVDIADYTFSSSTGLINGWNMTQAAYGSAGACAWGAILGHANVDLRGTSFAVAPNAFSWSGWPDNEPHMEALYSANNQVVDIAGGGYCGGTSPTNNKLQLVFTGVTDSTAPSITASATSAGNPYSAGWTNHDVVVQFTCADAESGVASCPSNVTVSTEGANQSASGTATDNAGNTSAPTRFSNINIDKTAPTVTYSGNTGSYNVDQTVNITCSASDSLSGIASSACANVTGPAYTFALGTNTFSASATDKAGNAGTGSTSFTVANNPAALSSLIGQLVSDPGVAQSLQTQVASIGSAPNPNAKAGKLDAFSHFLSAQTGKSLSAQQANVILKLATAL